MNDYAVFPIDVITKITTTLRDQLEELSRRYQQRSAENIALKAWRVSVTAALQNPGGAHYDDVPKLVAALRAENERLRGQVAELETVNGFTHGTFDELYRLRAENGLDGAIRAYEPVCRGRCVTPVHYCSCNY